jgi:hypothetical protein
MVYSFDLIQERVDRKIALHAVARCTARHAIAGNVPLARVNTIDALTCSVRAFVSTCAGYDLGAWVSTTVMTWLRDEVSELFFGDTNRMTGDSMLVLKSNPQALSIGLRSRRTLNSLAATAKAYTLFDLLGTLNNFFATRASTNNGRTVFIRRPLSKNSKLAEHIAGLRNACALLCSHMLIIKAHGPNYTSTNVNRR